MTRKSSFSLECKPNRYIDDGDCAIYRIRATFTIAQAVQPVFLADVGEVVVLERGCDGNDRGWALVSVRLEKTVKSFTLSIVDPTGLIVTEIAKVHTCGFVSLRIREFLVTRDAGATHLYNGWFKRNRVTAQELLRQRGSAVANPLVFSIVVPLFQTPANYLRHMVESVCAQSYPYWQLILVNAGLDDTANGILDGLDDARIVVLKLSNNQGITLNTNAGLDKAEGDFICFLDHDDFLEPDTLFRYQEAVANDPACDVVYCDEDSFSDDGKFRYPIFKPDFSPEFLLSHNYITHFLAIRKTLIDAVGYSSPDMDGAQDYDLTLRATESARAVCHVPRILYHWRMHEGSTNTNAESKPYAQDAGLRAVQAHCNRVGSLAEVEATKYPYVYRTRFLVSDEPLVSIIIPNSDKGDVLKACVESIIRLATYDNYEIVVVDNNSREAYTSVVYRELKRYGKVDVVDWGGPFNYSEIINFGAKHARGAYLLLLNNDTNVISPDFIETMLGLAQQDGIGVVGAKLLYRDNTIQHAGVALGPWGEAVHVNQYFPDSREGYCGRAVQMSNFTAVTGACQMVSRSVFEQVGGYDSAFAVGFNDIDFCCRVIGAGYRVVLAPDAKLYHDEFTSRGRDCEGEAQARFEKEKNLMHERWPSYFNVGDPYMNQNFDRNALYFNLPVGAAQLRRLLP